MTIFEWLGIAIVVGKIITNITPTEKDNNWLDGTIDFIIPNLKKGGGKHKMTILDKIKDKIT